MSAFPQSTGSLRAASGEREFRGRGRDSEPGCGPPLPPDVGLIGAAPVGESLIQLFGLDHEFDAKRFQFKGGWRMRTCARQARTLQGVMAQE